MSGFKKKWRGLINKCNELGVPLPTVRDPKTGKGSITATLVVISSGLITICILFMLGVFISRITNWFNLTDVTLASVKEAFSSAMQFYIASLAAYLGRKASLFKADEKIKVNEKKQ